MKVNLHFKREILDLMIGGRDITYCYQCGYCNTVCPVHQRLGSEYNPRDLVLFSLLGYKDALLGNPNPMAIWGCTGCETCDEACPSEIPITDIIYLLKNMSAGLGKAPDYYQKSTKVIMDNSKAIPVQAAIEKRRTEKLGLPPTPKCPVDDVKAIMEATGVPELIQKYQKEEGAN